MRGEEGRGGTGRFTARSGACVYKATGSVCVCVCVGRARKQASMFIASPSFLTSRFMYWEGKKVCGG